MTVQKEIEKIRNSENSENSDPRVHLAAQIISALEPYSTEELFKYIRDNLNCNVYLRSWLEDQIVAAEINYQKYN